MKRSLTIFLFLITSFFFIPHFVLAETITPTLTPTSTATASSEATSSAEDTEQSVWDKFWSWLTSIFIKTDYNISQRTSKEINSDMTKYGNADDGDKHSSPGSRLTSSASQNCYKGNVIKKVILETSGYPDSEISHICLNSSNQCSVSSETSCQTINISDLAHYFVQINQQFYCDDKNKLIDTSSDVVDKVNTKFSDTIPDYELDCYKSIYKDFYLIPKENSDESEENSKKIIQTPISANDQKPNSTIKETKEQLDQNFTPSGKSWDGLNSLRPAGW